MSSTTTKLGMFLTAAIVLLSSCRDIQKTENQSSSLAGISEVEGRDKLAMGEFLRVITNNQGIGSGSIAVESLSVEHITELNGDDSYVVEFSLGRRTRTVELSSQSDGYHSARSIYYYLLDESGNSGTEQIRVRRMSCDFVEQDGFPGSIVTTDSCAVRF